MVFVLYMKSLRKKLYQLIKMTLKFHSSLLKDIASMLNNNNNCNVIIQVEHQEFLAHSNILRARSPYFKNELSTDKVKNGNNLIKFRLRNITSTVFNMILK